MRRPILSTVLLLGAVFGFTAGAHHGFGRHHGPHGGRHDAFYDRVAEVCVDAARRHDRARPPMPPPHRGHHGR